MKLSGSYTFSAPREEVWELLNDPVTLQRIIPGCERLEQIGEDLYAADIKLGLAGVRGDYSGTVRIADQRPPEHYQLEGDGRGKPGFAKGVGTVELTADADDKTTMRYKADAQVGGPVAGIGQRLIEGAAKSIINQSLKALAAELETRHTAGHGAVSGSAVAAQPEATAAAPAETDAGATPEVASSSDPDTITAPTAEVSVPAPASTASQPRPLPPMRPAPPVEPSTGLTTTDVVRGIADDFISTQPWLRWALPMLGGLLLGLLIGRRTGRSD